VIYYQEEVLFLMHLLFGDIEYMDRTKNRTFDEFNDLSANASKDSIKEHEIKMMIRCGK